MSRTTEQFTLGNISHVWSNTARWRKKSFFKVNKENTVTSTVWMIPTVPHAVRKQRWTYRRKPETVQHSAASSNYRAKHTSGIYTMFPSSQLDVLKEDLFYAHQGCIYLLKNAIKTVMLLTIVMICNIIFW